MEWIHKDEVRRLLRDTSAARLAQAPKADYAAERRNLLRGIGDGG